MIDLTKDIHSLTEFKRSTTRLMAQMKKTGHPLVLTVNGKASLVVYDAESYQKLLKLIDRAEAIEGIKAGLESFARGEGRPAREVLEEIRERHEISS